MIDKSFEAMHHEQVVLSAHPDVRLLISAHVLLTVRQHHFSQNLREKEIRSYYLGEHWQDILSGTFCEESDLGKQLPTKVPSG
jgi:hypothetical protein